METNTNAPAIGETMPGYAWTLSDIVRVDGWGPCSERLEPIAPRDAAAPGWSTAPAYRLRSPGTGLRLAVAVTVTGRAPRRWSGGYWIRCRVEFCGDGEPSAVSGGWILANW